LCANGWVRERVAVIVAVPEIEAWLRFDSLHLSRLLKQDARKAQEKAELLFPTVISSAIAQTGGANALGKPRNPKEAFAAVLREFGIQRSNAVYGKLAAKESLRGCLVPSFRRLVATLQQWFPAKP
jgi:hypothetical protein